MKWRVWEKHERQSLIGGEIIRRKIDKRKAINPPADWDGYLYGCVSGGFGMHKDLIGSALFVENESWSYDDCLSRTSRDSARWERNSKIQILVD